MNKIMPQCAGDMWIIEFESRYHERTYFDTMEAASWLRKEKHLNIASQKVAYRRAREALKRGLRLDMWQKHHFENARHTVYSRREFDARNQ